MNETVYITPAGWICTCGSSHKTPTYSTARREGHNHAQGHPIQASVTDYPEFVSGLLTMSEAPVVSALDL